jgi:hypothetical protein
MTRLILKVIDVGASAVFIALCTKAFCVYLSKQPSARSVHQRRIVGVCLRAVDPPRRWPDTPMQTFLDAIPMTKEKMIAA